MRSIFVQIIIRTTTLVFFSRRAFSPLRSFSPQTTLRCMFLNNLHNAKFDQFPLILLLERQFDGIYCRSLRLGNIKPWFKSLVFVFFLLNFLKHFGLLNQDQVEAVNKILLGNHFLKLLPVTFDGFFRLIWISFCVQSFPILGCH